VALGVIDVNPVASGFGSRSDWFVTAQPEVTVTWRHRRFAATAHRLGHDDATELFEGSRRDHATASRPLAEACFSVAGIDAWLPL